MNVLFLMLILPLVVLLINCLFPKENKLFFKLSSYLVGLSSLIISLFVHYYVSDQVNFTGFNYVQEIKFFAFSFPLSLGVDGVSTPMMVLTSLLVLIVTGLSEKYIDLQGRDKSFFCLLILMSWGLNTTFMAHDLFTFYVAWEVVLIPAFFMIGIFGGKDRIKAAVHFFIYTLAGSLFLLLAFAYLVVMIKETTGQYQFSFAALSNLHLAYNGFCSPQALVGFALLFAFFIKAPLVPFHGWMKSTYMESPTLLTALIAGVMGKMGVYGLIRFLNLTPDFNKSISHGILYLAAFGIIYGAFVAIKSKQLKEVITYSSLSHVSYIVFGIFAFNTLGLTGAIYQMFNHGILIAGLFIVVAHLEKNSIVSAGGLLKFAPVLGTTFFILVLGSIGLPLTNGFVGEFFILLSGLNVNSIATVIACLGMVFGAVYMLKAYSQNMFGLTQSAILKDSVEVVACTKYILIFLSIIVLLLGVYPKSFFGLTDRTVQNISSKLIRE